MGCFKYSIGIKRPSEKRLRNESCKDEKFIIWYDKRYGDRHGGVSGFATLDKLKSFIKEIIKTWEEYDSILGRTPDKVTAKNLAFESFTSEISISDIFGIQTLGNWM